MEKEKYVISVGEPWNFESIDGQNIIKGIVLEILNDKCLIFKANNCLEFNQAVGNVLILSPRCKDENFNNLSNKSVTINGGLLLIDYNKDLIENELKNNSKFVIIGSISREDII
jgi:hypothetical protein